METDPETVRVWLVERTYSDDEQNLVVLEYATTDGARYLRKERALPSFGDERETPVSLDVPADSLAATPDGDRDRYARIARTTSDDYEPGDAL